MKLDFERFKPMLMGIFHVFKRLLPILTKLFIFFERFVPVFASYFLERPFKDLKTRGLIEDYRTRFSRTGKSHFRIDVRLVLTTDQLIDISNDLIDILVKYFNTHEVSPLGEKKECLK